MCEREPDLSHMAEDWMLISISRSGLSVFLYDFPCIRPASLNDFFNLLLSLSFLDGFIRSDLEVYVCVLVHVYVCKKVPWSLIPSEQQNRRIKSREWCQ